MPPFTGHRILSSFVDPGLKDDWLGKWVGQPFAEWMTNKPGTTSHCTGVGNDKSIGIVVTGDNVHSLTFEGLPGKIKAQVKCAGDAPAEAVIGSCNDEAVKAALKCDPVVTGADIGGLREKTKVMTKALQMRCQASKEPMKLLMLGLGGGVMQTSLMKACPNMEITTVEHDPNIIQTAKDFFGFDGKVIEDDGRNVLAEFAQTPGQFDGAVVDIANAPFTRRDARNLHRALKPGGFSYESWSDDKSFRAHLGQFKEFFTNVKIEELPTADKGNSFLLLGEKNPAITLQPEFAPGPGWYSVDDGDNVRPMPVAA